MGTSSAPVDPLPLGRDQKVLSTPTPFLTRIKDPDKGTELVQTMLPTKAMDDDSLKMADYKLEATAAAFHPANPLVDTTIYRDFDKGIRFDKQGYSVRLSGGSSTDAPTRVENKAFYGNLVRDTDALVTPTSTGVETTLFVRSAAAPRETAMQFDLDDNEALRYATPVPGGGPAVATGIEITRDGKPIAQVAAPNAVDAQGRSVQVNYRIEGSKMILELPPCGKDIDCPYAVDPIIDNYAIDANGNQSPTQTRDPFYYWRGYGSFLDPNGDGYTGTDYRHDPDGFWMFRGFDGSSNGLYVYAPISNNGTSRYLLNGEYGEWVWRAPGDSVVSRAVFGQMAFQSYGTCVVEGVYNLRANTWEMGIYSGAGSGASPWFGSGGSGANDACASRSNDTRFHDFTGSGATRRPGSEVVFGATSIGNFYLGAQTTAYLYGSAITLDDIDTPTVTPDKTKITYVPASGSTPTTLPTGWIGDGTLNVEGEVYDPGLGVKDLALADVTGASSGNGVSLAMQSAPVDLAQTTQGVPGNVNACYGGKDSRCPRIFNVNNGAKLSLPVSRISEGARSLRLSAHDAVGSTIGDNHTVTVADFPIRVDLARPSLDVGGRAYDDRVIDTGPDGGDSGGYFSDQEPLTVTASDSGSGVASVEVRIDGQHVDALSYNANCATQCPASAQQTFDLSPAALGLPANTTHSVDVVVKDQLGDDSSVGAAHRQTQSFQIFIPASDGTPDESADPAPDDGTPPPDATSCETDDAFSDPDSCQPPANLDPSSPLGLALAEPALSAVTETPLIFGQGVATTRSVDSSSADTSATRAATKCAAATDSPVGPPTTVDRGRYGISDQDALVNRRSFADSRLQALNVRRERLIVPYDLVSRAKASGPKDPGCTDYLFVRDWIKDVISQNNETISENAAPIREPLISFEHRRSPGGITTLPKLRPDGQPNAAGAPFAYSTAIGDFMAMFPAVGVYTAWNEPNNRITQPTNSNDSTQATRARRAGQFYRELFERCGRGSRCLVAAGDFLDDASFNSNYRSLYFSGMGRRQPPVWAFHAYRGIERGTTGREKLATMLKFAAGRRVWLTEQGAYRTFPSIGYTCENPQQLDDAAAKLRNFFASSVYQGSQVRRFYYYSSLGSPCGFDTGLISGTAVGGGSIRPVYDVLKAQIASTP